MKGRRLSSSAVVASLVNVCKQWLVRSGGTFCQKSSRDAPVDGENERAGKKHVVFHLD